MGVDMIIILGVIVRFVAGAIVGFTLAEIGRR